MSIISLSMLFLKKCHKSAKKKVSGFHGLLEEHLCEIKYASYISIMCPLKSIEMHIFGQKIISIILALSQKNEIEKCHLEPRLYIFSDNIDLSHMNHPFVGNRGEK